MKRNEVKKGDILEYTGPDSMGDIWHKGDFGIVFYSLKNSNDHCEQCEGQGAYKTLPHVHVLVGDEKREVSYDWWMFRIISS